jgi:dUTP pyrophosphatase
MEDHQQIQDIVYLKVKSQARVPRAGTILSLGMDLTACVEEPLTIRPGQNARVCTGIAFRLPPGYFGDLRSTPDRAASGLVTLPCAPIGPGKTNSNLLDKRKNTSTFLFSPDFTGEVVAFLHNASTEVKVVAPGDRICQLVLFKANESRLVEEQQNTLPAIANKSMKP